MVWNWALYVEALTHFLGGDQQTIGVVPLSRNGNFLGNQRMFLLAPDTALRITAFPDHTHDYERSLRAMLKASPLRAIQWVNFKRHTIQFISIL